MMTVLMTDTVTLRQRTVSILVSTRYAVSMHSAMQPTIKLSVFVLQATMAILKFHAVSQAIVIITLYFILTHNKCIL